MVADCLVWTEMVADCLVWTEMVADCLVWTEMVADCLVWTEMVADADTDTAYLSRFQLCPHVGPLHARAQDGTAAASRKHTDSPKQTSVSKSGC